jgi:hypothetical protein
MACSVLWALEHFINGRSNEFSPALDELRPASLPKGIKPLPDPLNLANEFIGHRKVTPSRLEKTEMVGPPERMSTRGPVQFLSRDILGGAYGLVVCHPPVLSAES